MFGRYGVSCSFIACIVKQLKLLSIVELELTIRAKLTNSRFVRLSVLALTFVGGVFLHGTVKADRDPSVPDSGYTFYGSSCQHYVAPSGSDGLTASYDSNQVGIYMPVPAPSTAPVLCGGNGDSGQNASSTQGSTGGYSGAKPVTVNKTLYTMYPLPGITTENDAIIYVSMGGFGGSGGNDDPTWGKSASTGGRGGYGGDVYLTYSPMNADYQSQRTLLTSIFVQSIGGNGVKVVTVGEMAASGG